MARQRIERKLDHEERNKLYLKLVHPNDKLIVSTVKKYTKNPSNVENNTQDVRIRILEYIDTYDETKDLNVWIITIAVRLTGILESKHSQSYSSDDGESSYIKKYRPKNHITYQCIDDMSKNDFVDETPHYTEIYSYSDEVEDAIQSLEPKYARAFLFRHSWGLSYRDIAELEGIPENTAKNRVHKGKIYLESMLTDRDIR